MFEKVFKLSEHQTTVKTEVMAGITTFMTMAYILAVNPSILGSTGMDPTAVLLASFIGTACMAFMANLPFVLSAGMGLNAYMAYTVCAGYGYSWHVALLAVFAEGLIFIVLSLTNVREAIFNAIPMNLKRAVSAGIGVYICFIGLASAHVIVANPATKVSLFSFKGAMAAGTFHTAGVPVVLAIVGILFTAILIAKKVRGNILWHRLHMGSRHHLRTDRRLCSGSFRRCFQYAAGSVQRSCLFHSGKHGSDSFPA